MLAAYESETTKTTNDMSDRSRDFGEGGYWSPATTNFDWIYADQALGEDFRTTRMEADIVAEWVRCGNDDCEDEAQALCAFDVRDFAEAIYI